MEPPLPPIPALPPPPPASKFSLAFNGIDDYFILPTLDNLRSVSLWVFVDATQPSVAPGLVDLRPGSQQGAFNQLYAHSLPAPNALEPRPSARRYVCCVRPTTLGI